MLQQYLHNLDRPMVLMRHGRTEWNRRGLVMGTNDVPLDVVGKRQALTAAKEISRWGVDVIYSSPLTRCIQTSEIVSEHIGLKIIVIPELCERDWGIYQGQQKCERIADENPKEGETASEFRWRVLNALDSIRTGALPLVVTHSGVLRLILLERCSTKATIAIPNAKPLSLP